MICTIDVGNSNIVCILYNETQEIVEKKRFETITDLDHAYDAYTAHFKSMTHSVHKVILSCVVPRIHDLLMRVLEDVFKCPPISVSQKTIPTFKNLLDNPDEIGADFIASAIGAMKRFRPPLVIVDVGSATKITAVNQHGAFKGGIIIPGLGESMKSMHAKIPHLPQVSFEFPQQVIGHDTVSAIQSGIMYATYYQIRGLTQQVQHELGESCTVVLTGGYSSLFKARLHDYIWIDDLVNEGLFHLAQEDGLHHD